MYRPPAGPWRPARDVRLTPALLLDASGPDAPARSGLIRYRYLLGGQRREHADLEIAVPRERFTEVAAVLAGFELFVPVSGPGNGQVWPLAEAGDLVEEHHQTWVREPGTGRWRLDVFREPSDRDTWIFRRDERIRMSYDKLIEHTADGIPFARPEVALLFKAKWSDLPKNQADFADTLPRLEPAPRRWLRESLALVHPGHPWLAELA